MSNVHSRPPFRVVAVFAVLGALGSIAQSQPPPSVEDLLSQVTGDSPPLRGATKPDGSRYTTSAARYADSKVASAPRTVAKLAGRPIPSWLHLSSEKYESTSLAEIPQVGLKPASTSKEFREAFVKIYDMHAKGSDAFLHDLVQDRPELAGLPFLMGDACKLSAAQAGALRNSGASLRNALDPLRFRDELDPKSKNSPTNVIWTLLNDNRQPSLPSQPAKAREANTPAAALPALMQILAVEAPEYRDMIALSLQSRPIGDDASIAALVRLAIFDPDPKVRATASCGLRCEPMEKWAPKLLEGFRYPWPIVAERTAEALVAIDRPDVLPRVVDLLDQPDPAMPFERQEGDKKVLAVREVVKLNHHQSCVVCHATAARQDFRTLSGLVARVPDPEQAMPPMNSRLYYDSRAEEVVRADETYLRQDFSVMREVADSGKWPKMQRFDYVVRARTLTPDQADAIRNAPPPLDGEVVSPHRRAVLFALSKLTSTYVGASADDWRPVIERRLAKER
jgi:hypothetical protein